MCKKIIPFCILLTLLSTSCDVDFTGRKPVVHTYESDGFRFTFSLQTEEGIPATVFWKGESVVSHFAIENLTGDTAYIAQSYSDARNNDTFCRIYRLSDNKDMGRPGWDSPCIWYECRHYAPDTVWVRSVNYPKDDSGELSYLPRGEYYIDFSPRFAYCDTCMHIYNPYQEYSPRPIDIDIPRFTIQFKVL